MFSSIINSAFLFCKLNFEFEDDVNWDYLIFFYFQKSFLWRKFSSIISLYALHAFSSSHYSLVFQASDSPSDLWFFFSLMDERKFVHILCLFTLFDISPKKSTFQIIDKSHKQIILSILFTFKSFPHFFFFFNFLSEKNENFP